MSSGGYSTLIHEATGATGEDADAIEELMRVGTGGNLDHLTRNEFFARAREAQAAKEILDEEGWS